MNNFSFLMGRAFMIEFVLMDDYPGERDRCAYSGFLIAKMYWRAFRLQTLQEAIPE